VADDFSGRYGDLLTGSYDCVDRIVLNAYFSLGHNPGGFRVWWRHLHHDSDEQLDNTHLMRMAGRFARRLKGWANTNGVPVIYCKAGERKHLIAEEYLDTHEVGTGVFMVLAAKAPASVWVPGSSPPTPWLTSWPCWKPKPPRRRDGRHGQAQPEAARGSGEASSSLAMTCL
jgi:hypothetical protein